MSHRSTSVEATWRKFSPLAKSAGITRVADVTGLDTLGIPVFTAIRPMGRSLSTSQGKGITAGHARVSALMESLETWTAENLALPTVRSSAKKLGKRAVDVRELARPKGKLDRDATWRWVEGRELVTDTSILVPEQAVTLDTTFTKPPVFDISSNGLASGNTINEAVVHALCEVLERDAEAAWRRSGSDHRIVLDSIADPVCRDLIGRITATGARVFLWNLDGVIPVCGCAIMEDPHEPAWRTLGMYQGFGAHVRPEYAIARAITEAAQTRLTYIVGARDDFFPFDYERSTDPELLADIWDRLAAPCDEPALFEDLGGVETASLAEDFDALMNITVASGAEQIIAVDLTHPQLRVPVVKVVVPGAAVDVEAMG
ncbi:MAG TPA: YcaO-like family protein [Kofleriaceae bacterium]|jgi:ribosomal protein S12 methylthiotransferase accessory factor